MNQLEPNIVEHWITAAPIYWMGGSFVISFLFGSLIVKLFYMKKFGDVNKKIEAMLLDAKKDVELGKKEVDLERKDLILKTKANLEKEINQRRSEISVMEKRIISKEELLEKKYLSLEEKEDNFRKREDNLFNKEKNIGELVSEATEIRNKEKNELLSITHLSEEDAKKRLFKMLDDSLELEKANMIRKSEAEAKLQADRKARNILVLSIQKQAIDQCQEHSTKMIPIQNDEMKGRIIGREGRNIRAFEQICGVDLIVDDTPDAILVSSFDPIRKHIAKISLEKLLADGRIHPARIEEIVSRVRKDTGAQVKDVGENSVLDLGIASMHPDLIKLIGQLQFRFSYGQQQLQHSIEVAQLAGIMAGELGVDIKLAKRAGLLHDIGKAVTHEIEGSHAMIGADLCRKYGECADVEHAVRAHHHDVEPRTVLAFLIDACDAISGSRPAARSKTEVSYIQRLEKLEEICLSYKGVQRSYAVQAGRDVRVLVDPTKISDDQAVLLVRDITRRITDEMQFPGQIKVSVIREYRAIEVAM